MSRHENFDLRTLLVILFILPLGILAQDSLGKVEIKAQEYLDDHNYKKAIDTYLLLDTSSIDILRNLSMAWWKSGDVGNAQRGFAKVVEMEGSDPQDVFNYVRLLREVEYYEEADEQMSAYNAVEPGSIISNDFLKNKGQHVQLRNADTAYNIIQMNMNSVHQDFGVAYFRGGVCFVSSRESVKPIRRRYVANQLSFLDLYTANTYDTNFVAISAFPGGINGKYHEGPASFNTAGDFMILSKTDAKPASDGHYHSHLYSSNGAGNMWSLPRRLDIDSSNCSSVHPSISADGKWLYFASTMAGGYGGSDIWKVEIKGDGIYGAAINLGKGVNSEGNEEYPFIHSENNLLFFASDGRYGLGGFDVFVAEVSADGNATGSINLGAPVNTSQDDFGFILNAEKTLGYLSSNRKGTKGSDDLWFVEIRSGFVVKNGK